MNEVFGSFDTIKANAPAYLPLFMHVDDPLTRAGFKQLCMYERSADGSNRSSAESSTIYAWEMFLLNVEGLRNVMTFEKAYIRRMALKVTQSRCVPKLVPSFIHSRQNRSRKILKWVT